MELRVRELRTLLLLTPRAFEAAVADLLTETGYTKVKVSGGPGDLAADITCRDPEGRRVIVQCKQYAVGRTVGSKEIQQCLAISRVLVHDLRGGFASEAMGTIRALHEAAQLLTAVAFHQDEELVRRWLAGDWIRQKEVRHVIGRKQALADERMQELGIEPHDGDVEQLGADLYDLLSRSAHHRRGGFNETFSALLREFTYGPHPNAEIRGHHVDYAGELLEQALMVLADAFGDATD